MKVVPDLLLHPQQRFLVLKRAKFLSALMPQFFKHSLFIRCFKFKKTLMFHKSNNYWETLPLLDCSWLCFNFPRKSCCDSRFLHLHQFLSGNFLARSLIWTFTSQSSCSPPCFHPAWSSHIVPLFRLQYSCVTRSRFTERKLLYAGFTNQTNTKPSICLVVCLKLDSML